MKHRKLQQWIINMALCTAIVLPLSAQDAAGQKKESAVKADDKKPSDGNMMAMMMEMAKPGENHKRMQGLVGTWSYTTKWWMSPDAPPSESSGTMVARSVMEGRYLVSDHTGKMQMPGPDGKPMDMEFKGMAVEGYDNAKKKYVASWIDNMGTGIMNLEGTYDSATKALTYLAEYEAMPGMKMKIREVVTKIDDDHNRMEFFEDRGGKEVKTMQIDYARKS
jgi:hypothetical protein